MVLHALLLLSLLLCSAHARAYASVSSKLAGSPCVTRVDDYSFDMEHVGENVVVTTHKTGEKIVVPPCTNHNLQHGPAWKAFAQFNATQGFSGLYGEWNVPNAPTGNTGQTLFWWNGVEPSDNSAVLQPVLQWGVSANGGGNYWAIASWFVSSTHGTIVSKLVQVKDGDIIIGANTMDSKGLWVINATSQNTGQSTSFTYNPKIPYIYAYEVLEAYSITACTQYPSQGTVDFTKISVDVAGKSVTPKWQAFTQQPITCNEHAEIKSDTEVVIHY